jgi:hypothetical protein
LLEVEEDEELFVVVVERVVVELLAEVAVALPDVIKL